MSDNALTTAPAAGRAASAGRPGGNGPDVPENGQYLTFNLGGEMFAIGILSIKEIIEYGQLTTVPMMPVYVRGVINLRGAVVPVLDLQARFGRDSSAVGKRTCIVIVEVRDAQAESQIIGVVVDSVSEVIDIAAADVEPAPTFGTRIRGEFIRGMGKVRGKFVILLDVDRALSFDEMHELRTAQEVALA
jgi:purine-binding chemotaxis protein CheW